MARVRLRKDQLIKFFGIAEVSTDHARAHRLGIDTATYSRVMRGVAAPGERFIAGACSAFADAGVSFEDLFEVVSDDSAAAAS